VAQCQIDDERVGHVLVKPVVHNVHHDDHVQDHAQQGEGCVLDEEQPVDRFDAGLQDRTTQPLHVHRLVGMKVQEVGQCHGILVVHVAQLPVTTARTIAAGSTASGGSSSASSARRQLVGIRSSDQAKLLSRRHPHHLQMNKEVVI